MRSKILPIKIVCMYALVSFCTHYGMQQELELINTPMISPNYLAKVFDELAIPIPIDLSTLIIQYTFLTQQETQRVGSIIRAHQRIIRREEENVRRCCRCTWGMVCRTIAAAVVVGGIGALTLEALPGKNSSTAPIPNVFCINGSQLTGFNANVKGENWRATVQNCAQSLQIQTSPLQCASAYNSTYQLAINAQTQLNLICGPQATYCVYADTQTESDCTPDNLATFAASLNTSSSTSKQRLNGRKKTEYLRTKFMERSNNRPKSKRIT